MKSETSTVYVVGFSGWVKKFRASRLWNSRKKSWLENYSVKFRIEISVNPWYYFQIALLDVESWLPVLKISFFPTLIKISENSQKRQSLDEYMDKIDISNLEDPLLKNIKLI